MRPYVVWMDAKLSYEASKIPLCIYSRTTRSDGRTEGFVCREAFPSQLQPSGLEVKKRHIRIWVLSPLPVRPLSSFTFIPLPTFSSESRTKTQDVIMLGTSSGPYGSPKWSPNTAVSDTAAGCRVYRAAGRLHNPSLLNYCRAPSSPTVQHQSRFNYTAVDFYAARNVMSDRHYPIVVTIPSLVS